MIKRVTILIIVLVMSSSIAVAGDWEWSFMGVNSKHFKDRSPLVIILGMVSSYYIHEQGHLVYARGHGGGDWDGFGHPVEMYKDDQSHSEIQMFHRAGFLAQLIVGGVLTAIPYTRHKDFTLGFNGYTTVGTAVYTITGGLGNSSDEDRSDIKQLDHGHFEGAVYTGCAAMLTYINTGVMRDVQSE